MITNANMTAGVSGVLWHYEQVCTSPMMTFAKLSFYHLGSRIKTQFSFRSETLHFDSI